MTDSQETIGVSPSDLTEIAADVLSAAGVDHESALVVAKSLVAADLKGIHSHGVSRLGIYAERLRRRGNAATGKPKVILDLPGLALLDGADLLSQIASAAAVDLAIDKARRVGCAAVCMRGGSHFGAAGYWAQLMAERDFVGIAATNTSPLMAAWGGSTTAIGTNPIAFAFPSLSGAPLVVDLATSESTWGAIVQAALSETPIPVGWALGRDGEPTSDPSEAIAARRLLPFGKHKGYALAVAIELLAGALAGAATLSDIPDMYAEPDRPMSVGHFFLAIDTRCLSPDVALPGAVARVQRELNDLEPQPGVDRVLWPGQLEADRVAARGTHGIPLPLPIARELAKLAESLDVGGPFSASVLHGNGRVGASDHV